ncbi:hypothetical protein p1B272 (plasmid) [Aromatoleum aromaticum EbN1]|uniref:Uncharacterized protein n=1 Tax=Aromatoleum aromaticum (strain DSM 19018 / LMG 30748 / EbN1) TaxID=76114 RepID=Q5NWV8_AROAE|nr:hypothetical protein p1B272 [Aromatoleum aromaticum EbN1]
MHSVCERTSGTRTRFQRSDASSCPPKNCIPEAVARRCSGTAPPSHLGEPSRPLVSRTDPRSSRPLCRRSHKCLPCAFLISLNAWRGSSPGGAIEPLG